MKRRQPTRTVYLSPTMTQVDGGVMQHIRPETVYDGPFHDLLARLARVAVDDAGLNLVLDQGAHIMLGWPAEIPAPGTDVAPFIAARNVGWKVGDPRPWTTFHAPGRPTIHVAVVPWLSQRNFPLWDANPAVMCTRLTRFHEWTGVPFHGRHGGLAGIEMLRRLAVSKEEPRWFLSEQDCPPREHPISIFQEWRVGVDPDHEHVHGYDATLQYLAAFGVARLGVHHPRHMAYERPAGKHAAGCYEITVPEWRMIDYLPAPYGSLTPGERAWVANPIMDLITTLSDNYLIDFPEVHSAWISSATCELGKKFANTVRDAIEKARRHGDKPLIEEVKAIYRAGNGMLEYTNSDKKRIYRPDWAVIVRATAYANMWHKIWAQFLEDGRIPVSWDTDTVYYSSPDTDPYSEKSWPSTFRRRPSYKVDPIGAHMGTFKAYESGNDR